MPERIRKLNSVIKRELGTLILQEIDFKPGAFATISKVETTSDLSQAKIFVQGFPQADTDYVFKTIEHESGILQKLLNKRLHLKVLPRLVFVEDNTGEEVGEIDRALSS